MKQAFDSGEDRVRLKLAIGPMNVASQATAWASAVNANLEVETTTFAFDGLLARRLKGTVPKDRTDHPIPHYRLSPQFWRRWRVASLLRDTSHILNESNLPIFGDVRWRRFTDELEDYSKRGIVAGVVFHGSEVRDPDLSIERTPFSFFRGADPSLLERLRLEARRNREAVGAAGLQTFITTLDLLDHVPNATYLPLCVDVETWRNDESPFQHGPPRVLHRPSNSGWDTKGSRYIMPVLEKMERQGRIRVVRSGPVPRVAMRQLYERADIVIDQLQSGAYGVTSIEAMAAGRLVVASVEPRIRELLGGHVPLVEANPKSFGRVMEDLISDPDRMRYTASKGLRFVKQWHNGEESARALQQFLGLGETYKPRVSETC